MQTSIDHEYLATRDRDTVEFLPTEDDVVEHVTMWTDARGYARWSSICAAGYARESFTTEQ